MIDRNGTKLNIGNKVELPVGVFEITKDEHGVYLDNDFAKLTANNLILAQAVLIERAKNED